jgi:hypothetical protein
MACFDDRDRRARLEVLEERARDLQREILLEHEPMREHVAEARDPREARHAILRDERDVHLTLRGEEMMRAHEEYGDARRDDRAARLYRKTPTERHLGMLPIAGEEDVGEGAHGGRRRRS